MTCRNCRNYLLLSWTLFQWYIVRTCLIEVRALLQYIRNRISKRSRTPLFLSAVVYSLLFGLPGLALHILKDMLQHLRQDVWFWTIELRAVHMKQFLFMMKFYRVINISRIFAEPLCWSSKWSLYIFLTLSLTFSLEIYLPLRADFDKAHIILEACWRGGCAGNGSKLETAIFLWWSWGLLSAHSGYYKRRLL